MPANDLVNGHIYTVWYSGKTRRGSAREVLSQIKRDAIPESPLKRMGLPKYVATLVKDADFFVPRDILSFLRKKEYGSDFERALEYLAAMPTSGVRILDTQL